MPTRSGQTGSEKPTQHGSSTGLKPSRVFLFIVNGVQNNAQQARGLDFCASQIHRRLSDLKTPLAASAQAVRGRFDYLDHRAPLHIPSSLDGVVLTPLLRVQWPPSSRLRSRRSRAPSALCSSDRCRRRALLFLACAAIQNPTIGMRTTANRARSILSPMVFLPLLHLPRVIPCPLPVALQGSVIAAATAALSRATRSGNPPLTG